ncbi:unnamed protein product [Closterium sp. NIES-64]|nr:unnamed protein product [Closterium sp. NIES-64]
MVDSRNLKGALKLVNTLVQKAGNDQAPIKLVKALVLYRMGREGEALEVCGEVREEGRAGQLSERTLMDLMDLLARMGKAHAAIEAFEVAAAQQAGNLKVQGGAHEAVEAFEAAAAQQADNTKLQELLMGAALQNAFEAAAAQQAENMKLQELLVGAALKSRGYVKMQQAAMRMHKKRPKDDRFLLWAVCSMDLQAFEKENHAVCHLPPSVSSFHLPAPAAATSAPGATSAPPTPASAADVAKQRRQLLQLAEAMVQRKAQSEGGLKSAEALRLYVDLLRRQGKGEEVVRVLQGPMAALFTIKSDLLQIRGEVQQDLARFTDAAATFKDLLGVSDDDWVASLSYLDSLMLAHLQSSLSTPLSEAVAAVTADAATAASAAGTAPATAATAGNKPAAATSGGGLGGGSAEGGREWATRESRLMQGLLLRMLQGGGTWGEGGRGGGGGDGGGGGEGGVEGGEWESVCAVGAAATALDVASRAPQKKKIQEELFKILSEADRFFQGLRDSLLAQHSAHQRLSGSGQPEMKKVEEGSEQDGAQGAEAGAEDPSKASSASSSDASAVEAAASSSKGARVARGPFLMRLEVLLRRMRLLQWFGCSPGEVLSAAADLESALLGYFDRHGDMISFASDVQAYALALPTDVRARLGAELRSKLTGLEPLGGEGGVGTGESREEQREGSGKEGRSEEGEKEGKEVGESESERREGEGMREMRRRLRRIISVEQVDGSMGNWRALDDRVLSIPSPIPTPSSPNPALPSPPALISRAQHCVRLFLEASPLSAALDPREKGHADELLPVSASCLVEVYRRRQPEGVGYLIEAILVLTYGASLRPFSPLFNTMLVSLYGLLGCPSLALASFQRLSAKHIQLDTLTHLVLPYLHQSASLADVSALHADMRAFFNDHVWRDNADVSMEALRRGTFSKVRELLRRLKSSPYDSPSRVRSIREFAAFHHRLNHSHQRLLLSPNSLLLSLPLALLPPSSHPSALTSSPQPNQSASAAPNQTAASEPVAQVREVLRAAGGGREEVRQVVAEQLGLVRLNEDWGVRPWWDPLPLPFTGLLGLFGKGPKGEVGAGVGAAAGGKGGEGAGGKGKGGKGKGGKSEGGKGKGSGGGKEGSGSGSKAEEGTKAMSLVGASGGGEDFEAVQGEWEAVLRQYCRLSAVGEEEMERMAEEGVVDSALQQQDLPSLLARLLCLLFTASLSLHRLQSPTTAATTNTSATTSTTTNDSAPTAAAAVSAKRAVGLVQAVSAALAAILQLLHKECVLPAASTEASAEASQKHLPPLVVSGKLLSCALGLFIGESAFWLSIIISHWHSTAQSQPPVGKKTKKTAQDAAQQSLPDEVVRAVKAAQELAQAGLQSLRKALSGQISGKGRLPDNDMAFALIELLPGVNSSVAVDDQRTVAGRVVGDLCKVKEGLKGGASGQQDASITSTEGRRDKENGLQRDSDGDSGEGGSGVDVASGDWSISSAAERVLWSHRRFIQQLVALLDCQISILGST